VLSAAADRSLIAVRRRLMLEARPLYTQRAIRGSDPSHYWSVSLVSGTGTV
jgi:hypothetical protein